MQNTMALPYLFALGVLDGNLHYIANVAVLALLSIKADDLGQLSAAVVNNTQHAAARDHVLQLRQ